MAKSITHISLFLVVILLVSNITAKTKKQIHEIVLSENNFALRFFESRQEYTRENENQTLCLQQVKLVRNALEKNEIWAIKLLDAWAKIPSGILYGHTLEMGNFDECLSIGELQNSLIGKYCLAKVDFKEPKLILKLGLCVPSQCSAKELSILLNDFLDERFKSMPNISLSIGEDDCTMKDREGFTALDWVAVAIFSLIGLLLLLSTLYDYIVLESKQQSQSLLTAFSLRVNLRQLLQISASSSDVIPALNGIRCMSMIYIIYLHSYMMLVLSPTTNAVDMETWSESLFFMVWKNAQYAVDSFFFLSGLLLVLVSFKSMERSSGKLNIPLMYLHRYVRLSPVLYLALLYFMTLFRFSGNGPMWNTFTSSHKLCDESWWATLLYVQNYAAAGKMCLGHSWYLAVDFQLFLLSPLVLILIWRWRRRGLAVLSIVGLLLVACLFSIVVINGLQVFQAGYTPATEDVVQRKTYYSTHTRTSAWVIGILLGYYFYTNKNRRVIIPKIFVLLGWMTSIAMLLVVIFCLHWKTIPEANPLTPLEGAFYLSLSRVAWPLALCWIVFACEKGYAGPVNQFLSWWLWQPLSKLSYCLYIWHLIVVTINTGQMKINSHFSIYDGTLRFFGDFSLSLLVSLVMYLAIEAPILNIDKCLLTNRNIKIRTNGNASHPPNNNITISQQNLCD